MNENSLTYAASFRRTSVHELLHCLNGEIPAEAHTAYTTLPVNAEQWYIFGISE